MKTLFKNANIINVFTLSTMSTNLLIEDDIIIGFGDCYTEADVIVDLNGKYICPGLIDGHMHIESTMLSPKEFSKIALMHGTTIVLADPHEIANVCGTNGIKYMLDSTEGLPLDFFFMIPSCVPATAFDESFDSITADKMEEFYNHKRILGLAEVMNYPGVVYKEVEVLKKLELAKKKNTLIDGHAPGLTGHMLDTYIRSGIKSDHECINIEEAMEKISKGQYIMIREGSAAKNLEALKPLLDSNVMDRCLFVTDDRDPRDLSKEGHIDNIIRKASSLGCDTIKAIRVATYNAANYMRLENVGAIAPGYKADIIIFDNLEDFNITDVYKNGKKVVDNKNVMPFEAPNVDLYNTFNVLPLTLESFYLNYDGVLSTNVIEVIPNEIITNKACIDINYDINNGIDVDNDIIKIAVIERYKRTGHIGLGFIKGMGLKKGAIASSVSHDSHNIIVIGTNEGDMLRAAERIIALGGGNVVVCDDKILSEMKLNIGGLMSTNDYEIVAEECDMVRKKALELGVNEGIAPFMNMAFISLPVIPSLKMTTFGLFDVDKFELISLINE